MAAPAKRDTGAGRVVYAAEAGAVDAVAVGQLWRTDPPFPLAEDAAPLTAEERGPWLAEAFAVVAADLGALASSLALRGQPEAAEIAEASFLIASDPDLRAAAESALAAGASATAAVEAAAERFAALLEQLPDPMLAGRAADVRAVGRRLVVALSGARRATPPKGPLILIGHDVSADDLLMHADSVAAAATVVGGATSHAAIIARSLGVPMVFGMDPLLLETPEETEVLLDSVKGRVVVRPDPMERDEALVAAAAARTRRATLAALRHLPLTIGRSAGTGTHPVGGAERVTVLANVASVVDADLALGMEAAGVGLLRTEMPFLGAQQWPSRAEHMAELIPMLRRLSGRHVTVRTLDFSDDKLPPFLRRGRREAPLGRSLPLMLAEPQAFVEQLWAILSAGTGVTLRIMIPMVACAEEVAVCRDLVVRAAAELDVVAPPVGAMIELPEAVARIDEIAAVAGFLSLGTNDLTARVLGLGRRDPALTTARVTEPAVLTAIAATVRAGAAQGLPVSVCGDAASDPAVLPTLLDAGCRIFSVAPSMMDEVRDAVRALG
jgi:phosphoenolpyruvate-protein kinase (PTS system EI component)